MEFEVDFHRDGDLIFSLIFFRTLRNVLSSTFFVSFYPLVFFTKSVVIPSREQCFRLGMSLAMDTFHGFCLWDISRFSGSYVHGFP